MKLLCLLIILSMVSSLKGQNLKISNLIELCNLDITDSEDYLGNLNWKFIKSESKDNGLSYLSFSQKDINNNIVYLGKSYGKEKNFILMTFYSKTKKTTYETELKSNGFILSNKSMVRGYINVKYLKNNIEFEITTKPNNEYVISCVNYQN